MSYCNICKINLKQDQSKCPLCGNSPDIIDSTEKIEENPWHMPSYETVKKLFDRPDVRYHKNRFMYIFGFSLFCIMLISFIVNISITRNLNWAKFVILSCIYLWIQIIVPLKYFYKLKSPFIICVLFSATAIYLLLLDYFTSFNGWSLYPLLSLTLACFLLCIMLRKRIQIKNKISLSLLSVIPFVLLLDLINGFSGWSMYVGASIILFLSLTLLPFYLKGKYSAIYILVADMLFILGYLVLLQGMVGDLKGFLSLTLPLILTATLPPIFIVLISKKVKPNLFGVLSLCFFFASLMCLSLDYFLNVNIYKHDILFHTWAYVTAFSGLMISLLLIITAKNKRLQEYFYKKFNL